METIPIRTKQRGQFVDITEAVAERLTRSGVKDGVCVVYSPHTTAGITVNEHADPDVAHDILLTLDRLVPKDDPAFRHNEGNSDSHIKATLMGSSADRICQGRPSPTGDLARHLFLRIRRPAVARSMGPIPRRDLIEFRS